MEGKKKKDVLYVFNLAKRLGVVQVRQPCKIGIGNRPAATNQPLPGATQHTQLTANSFYLPLHKICVTHYVLLQFNQYKFRLETYALIIPFQFK